MTPQKRVGIWLRVSTDMQALGDSPEHHEQRARYYAKAKEWQIMEVYRLEAVSGKSVMDHPETKRMLADVRSGHITGLIFSKLARLARNTRELLDFSEIFRAESADLISLSESIDTSTPAGRLFYTMIAAMAEWERAEIAERVAASVPIRAKMGKPLGGQASFGYRWEGKEIVIDEKEAPVRKLIYELFRKYQRKKRTATELNALGYRTRHGQPFSDTTIARLLRDSTAKGERRANYTRSTGEGRKWVIKPVSDWVITPCPAVVSAELWDECNHILDQQERKNKNPGKTAVYLLSGFVSCSCGKTMYVHHRSKVYACKACKTRIAVADIDEIYQLYLKEYLTDITPAEYLSESHAALNEKQRLLSMTKTERAATVKKMNEYADLRMNSEITKDSFALHYRPLEERVLQLDEQIPELEAEIDFRKIRIASSDTVLQDARTLYEEWPDMAFDQKRGIVETITDRIEVGKEDITITLSYLPSQNAQNNRKNFRDSWRQPA